jgi:hypothetical protein
MLDGQVIAVIIDGSKMACCWSLNTGIMYNNGYPFPE